MAEHYPRIEEFWIGQNQSVDTPIAPVYYEGVGGTAPAAPVQTTDDDTVAAFEPFALLPGKLLFVSIENFGLNPFVFSALQSNDNGFTDAFGVINLRYNAASVASVTVQPGGKAAVLIETITKKTVYFKVPNASKYRVPATPLDTGVLTFPEGRVVATHFGGQLRRFERLGVYGAGNY